MNFWNICEWYGTEEVFKDIKIPNGIDRSILINSIMDECALYEPIVYDMPFLNQKVQNFFLKNYDVFDRLNKACNLEYEVIENYDRKEFINRDRENTNTETKERNNTSRNTEKTTDSTITTNKISPYDIKSYENDSQNENNYDRDSDIELNENETNNNNTNNKGKETETNWIHGNIGVTTSQQMLESEINIRPKLNIYKIISTSFFDEFMIKLL
jgi:hypothetical protein